MGCRAATSRSRSLTLERTDRDELKSLLRRGTTAKSDVLQTGDNLTGEWFTYRQAAELLSVSTEAVRQRAKRGRWQKTLGNDKRARIRPPDGWNDGPRINGRAQRSFLQNSEERALANQVIRVLEAHVETLKTQLAAAELRAEKQAAEFAAREARLAADLAVERTLADRMSARVDQMTADLLVEQAQRIEAEKRLAAELPRGWFKRRTPDAG
jgi:hypothetical protein